ncbi:MAG: CD3324 family protein [Clostridiaceae bacterium]|nr:CD3324 family protein [Clostridiaceae bacterium]
MSYIKAECILPPDVLDLVQKYADGQYLYIPKKTDTKKKWGENTGSKKYIKKRNQEIYENYLKGMKTSELAEKYFLSIKSIQRIVLQEKKSA